MPDLKPFASLSPTLLARKGAAKPAMRPQLQPLSHFAAPDLTPSEYIGGPNQAAQDYAHDDLGWNDMGDLPAGAESQADCAHDSANVLPFGTGEGGFETAPLTTGVPEVVKRQDALLGKIEAGQAEASGAPVQLAAHRWARTEQVVPRRSALAEGRRAAFTLRVDGERHLKLRLACAVEGRSAQQLITEALDRLLDALPEVDDLARRVKRR